MDIDLAKTFLAVNSAGSFIRAAERLHLTQTAVTARIRTLEQQIQCQLFIRNRSGARLTPEGERFIQYASELVNTWSRAKSEMLLPEGFCDRLRVGAETSLWNPLLINWVSELQNELSDVAVDAKVDSSSYLISALERGQLDAILVHRPSYYTGFLVEQILEEKLVHVQNANRFEPNLFINWGDDFVRKYDAAFSQPRQTAYNFDLGPMALQFMLQNGGNGWFRTRVVEHYLKSGELKQVEGSPEFTYPVFLTYRTESVSTSLERALRVLHHIAQLDLPWRVLL